MRNESGCRGMQGRIQKILKDEKLYEKLHTDTEYKSGLCLRIRLQGKTEKSVKLYFFKLVIVILFSLDLSNIAKEKKRKKFKACHSIVGKFFFVVLTFLE